MKRNGWRIVIFVALVLVEGAVAAPSQYCGTQKLHSAVSNAMQHCHSDRLAGEMTIRQRHAKQDSPSRRGSSVHDRGDPDAATNDVLWPFAGSSVMEAVSAC